MNEFKEAYIRFCDYLGEDLYNRIKSESIAYEEYKNLPRDKLAAILYVMFYEQVKLGWYKAKRAYHVNHDECDALSKLLERLYKVSETKITEETFNESYMYTVIYRALSGVTRALRNKTLEFNNHSCVSYNVTVQQDNYNGCMSREVELLEIIGCTSFEEEYLGYKVHELLEDEQSDNVKKVIEFAMKYGRIPQKYANRKYIQNRIKEIAENDLAMFA